MRDPFLISTSVKPKNAGKHLDWDESAADTQSKIQDVHDQERNIPDFFWTRTLLLLVFFLLTGRLAFLQVIKGEYFRNLSDQNRIRSQVLEAPRGIIFDRQNKPLLENVAGFNLVAVPFDLPKNEALREAQKLALVLGFEEKTFLEKINKVDFKSITPIVVSQSLSPDQAILFQTRASEFPGFSIDQSPIRHYFMPEEFSALLGYTSLADLQDIKHFNLNDDEIVTQVGKQGLEVQYENFLRGQVGENQVEVDSAGKIIKVLGQKQSQPGNSLVLNIDGDLQNELFKQLTKNGTPRAAAVALNPKTGEVLALISTPSFDNNLFAQGISSTDYQNLVNDPKKPFLNRAIAGQYPPGSTVKPMVAAAALTEKIVTPDTVIVDRGVLVIPNQFDPQVAYNFYGWKLSGLGPMTVRSAIAQSSDIYFYTVAGGHPNSKIAGLGAEKLAEYYKKFHLGKALGIDLPGEKPGIVADPNWKEKAFANDDIMKKWYLGDTYHIGIGQGDMLATPLQVAEWTAVIANNGVGMKPQIVQKALNMEGKTVFAAKPEILINKFLSDDVLKVVQEGMRLTVTSGSGRLLNNLPITSAGKTGTSQFDGSDPKRTHAWFTVYAPYEDPQIVITVLVEAGGEGHAVAEPVAREALLWWAKNRYTK